MMLTYAVCHSVMFSGIFINYIILYCMTLYCTASHYIYIYAITYYFGPFILGEGLFEKAPTASHLILQGISRVGPFTSLTYCKLRASVFPEEGNMVLNNQ